MIEKVKLTVDGETERILDTLTEALERRLGGEPPWVGELRKGIQELRPPDETPAWVDALRKGIAEDRSKLDKAIAALAKRIDDLARQVDDQHVLLTRLSRPWWKKLFGG